MPNVNTWNTDYALIERYNANDNEEHTQTWLDMRAEGYDMDRLQYLMEKGVHTSYTLLQYWKPR